MAREASIARRYLVHGRVQGVGYRYFAERVAKQLGLDGYVKNRADGTVEVYAIGPPAVLADLKRLLSSGPTMARVDSVEEREAEVENRRGFRVEF